jgi:hypothetical protein
MYKLAIIVLFQKSASQVLERKAEEVRRSRLTKRKRNRRHPPAGKLRQGPINQIAADEEEDRECVI